MVSFIQLFWSWPWCGEMQRQCLQKREQERERELHSSADEGRGEILPKTELLLIIGALKIARILSFWGSRQSCCIVFQWCLKTSQHRNSKMFNMLWKRVVHEGQSYYEMKQTETKIIVLKFWDSHKCSHGVFDLPWISFARDTMLIF